MTLHDAIVSVLNEHTHGVSVQEITDLINQENLYKNKDNSIVEPWQISIRLRTCSHLFTFYNGLVFLFSNFEKDKLVFDHIIHDVIASTSGYDISAKQTAIPIFIFLKRIIEADPNAYDIKISSEVREWYMSFDDNSNKVSDGSYAQILISIISEICDNNYQLNELKPYLLDLIKTYKESILWDLHRVLNKYSLDSKIFSIKEFGYFFDTLLIRLSKSIAHLGRASTPTDINKIITNIYNEPVKTVMDPFAGFGSTLITRNYWNESAINIGYENQKDYWLAGKLNWILNGINPDFYYNADTLGISGPFIKKADLIITDLPFGGSYKIDELDFLHWSKTKDSTGILLQYILDSLEKEGKAVVVIPASFLFSASSSVKQLKRELVNNDWLDAVISLPAGLFQPYANIASAIICIDLNKGQRGTCLFIDASEMKLIKSGFKETSIDDDNIDLLIHLLKDRPIKFSNLSKIHVCTINNEEIRGQEFDLSPKRYLLPASLVEQTELFKDEFIQLGDVLTVFSEKTENSENSLTKTISVKDLKSSLTDYILNIDEIPTASTSNSTNLNVIDQNVLLITTHFKNLKPTYFKFQQHPAILQSNIKAFVIDTTRLLPEYLIAQLHEPYFIDQLNAIRKGSAQSFFSIKDFLKLKVRVPRELEEQQKEYLKARSLQVEEKAFEADILKKKLEKSEAAALSNQIKLFRAIRHEWGNRLPVLKNTLDDLRDFFIKSSNKNIYSLESKVRLPIPGENENEIDSVNILFERAFSNLDYTISSLENLAGLIYSDPSYFKPEKIKLLNLLNGELNNFQKMKYCYTDNVHFDIALTENPEMYIDVRQFRFAFMNILQNAINHGCNDKSKEYQIVFQLVPDDNYDILIIKNNGSPLPEDFTIEKFKKLDYYAGPNGQSGFGGFIINSVIENHNAKMDIVKEIDPADSFKVQFEFKFPKVFFI